MRNSGKFFLLLLVVALLGLMSVLPAYGAFGERITVSGTEFYAGSSRIWINGANTPWNSWDDFGGSFDYAWWDNHFATLHANGINATRVWISCNGEVGININTAGYVSGCTATFWTNLDSLFQIAASRQVYIFATLISFDHFKDYHPSYQSWRNMITSSANIDSMINNYVIPFTNRYKNNPWLFCIEACNEIEWVHENAECGQIAWEWLQQYVGKVAKAVHENSTVLMTQGAASVKWNSDTAKAAVGNFWKDSALQAQVPSPLARVDFWSPHHYDWMCPWFGTAFYLTPGAYGLIWDRPAMIGESPAKGSRGHTTTADYENGYINGWQGAMGWTSNGVDRNGNLTNLGPATRAFRDNHYSLVFPI